jgi:hypothetical protein
MTTLVLKPRILTVVRALFKIGFLCCFTLGALPALDQFAGVLAQCPEWVTGTSDPLFVPTIGAATAFGALGLIGNYVQPSEAEED